MSRIIVPPVAIRIDDAWVYIIEVVPHDWIDGKKHYLVSCYVEWGGYRSQVFTLDVTSNKELEYKLRTEIAKMKLMIMSGKTELFKKIQ